MSEVKSQPFEEQRLLADKALETGQWPRHVCEEVATAFLSLLEAYALTQTQLTEMNEDLIQSESEIASFRETMRTLHQQNVQQFEAGRATGESERSKLGEINKNLSVEVLDYKYKLEEADQQLKQLTRNQKEAKQLLSVWLKRWQVEVDRTPESLVDRTTKLLQLDNA